VVTRKATTIMITIKRKLRLTTIQQLYIIQNHTHQQSL